MKLAAVLEVLAIALVTVALLKLRSVSRRLDRLQRRLDAVSPDPAGGPDRAEPSRPSLLARVLARGGDQAPQVSATGGSRSLAQDEDVAESTLSGTGAETRPNWMVWLGGVSVGLAGVFLVKYSIDQGLLTPWARVALGTVTGLAMHGLAEWLPRRTGRGHPAFSALAASGSVTLSAAALAALHLYQLVPAASVFAFLAAVFGGTMALALRHGPVLAALGLVGCYAVPLLVGGDDGAIVTVLGYCLIVSSAVMLMFRYVDRGWLRRGVLVGSLFWWMASMLVDAADGFRGAYLASLGAAIVFLPRIDWWSILRPGQTGGFRLGSGWRLPEGVPAAGPPTIGAKHGLTLLLLVLAQGLSIVEEPFGLGTASGWLPLVIVVFLAARDNRSIAPLPVIALAVQCIAWIGTGLGVEGFSLVWASELDAADTGFLVFAAASATVYTGFSSWNLRRGGSETIWMPLAIASPVCWLAVAYALETNMATSVAWALASVALGLLYTATGWVLARSTLQLLAPWAVLGCCGSYSLAVVMTFREGGLTLALAVQAVPLAWLAARYSSAHVAWMARAVLVAVVARLTLNPWLPTYDGDPYWTLWAYGGPTICCLVASRFARPIPAFRLWTEAACVHLLALTSWAVARDVLYGGDVFIWAYGLAEASITTVTWAAIGLAYYRRSLVSERMSDFYVWAARILLLLSLANYLHVVFPLNPIVTLEEVASTPIWNVLLLAYGAPVILAFLVYRYCEPGWARPAGGVAAVALFLFVTFEIRHLWQGSLDVLLRPTDGEMATYSVVWLCMAVTAVLTGGMRFGPGVYRFGMALLALTICKAFLVDMSGLTGLLRAGSFMGLGLSLLALAFLHQRFRKVRAKPGGASG